MKILIQTAKQVIHILVAYGTTVVFVIYLAVWYGVFLTGIIVL